MGDQKKTTEEELLEEVTSSEYKYGFTTKIESDKIEKIILLNTGGVTEKFYTWFGSNINMRLHDEDVELYEDQIQNKRSLLFTS